MSTTRRTTLSPMVSLSERAGEQDSQPNGRHRPHEWGGGPRGIVPAAFVVVLLVVATSYEGAFAISRWGPLALLVLAVLLGALIAARGKLARAPSASVIVLVASIWLLAGWSLLSMIWAQSSGDAFVAGDRMILYAAITTLPFVLPLSLRALVATGWSITLGVGAIALYVLVRLLAHGAPLYLAGRLNGPVDYRNATALLFALAVWPGVIAASARSYRRGIRAGALALATLCLGLAFLTQSRGIVLGLAIGAVPVFVLGPDRSRRAWVAILVVAGVAAASPWLLRPFHAFDGGHGYVSPHSISVAAWALAILTVAAFAVGLLIALFDNGLRPGSSRMTHTRLVARVALAAIIVAIVCAAGIAIGNPITYAHNKWDQFRSLQSSTPTTTRLGTVGGQRYDLWRVAIDEFDSAPLLGVGADNYSFDYYVERRTNRNLEDPHSLVFALLSELGVVGLGLFLLWLGGNLCGDRLGLANAARGQQAARRGAGRRRGGDDRPERGRLDLADPRTDRDRPALARRCGGAGACGARACTRGRRGPAACTFARAHRDPARGSRRTAGGDGPGLSGVPVGCVRPAGSVGDRQSALGAFGGADGRLAGSVVGDAALPAGERLRDDGRASEGLRPAPGRARPRTTQLRVARRAG